MKSGFAATRSRERVTEFRAALLDWYARVKRDLPWRRTRDPYRIWVSEIMLQQTRVEAVIPYYERFLKRFADLRALASAPEQELLAAWAGLGYYSRARNLQRAARVMMDLGGFPRDYAGILALPGIGNYTAAAIASISYDLPYAVLDGNVMRVLARVENERGDIRSNATRLRLQEAANGFLDREHPAEFNQAMMELGATVCAPREPKCLLCPVSAHCAARAAGVQKELPIKLRASVKSRVEQDLLIIEREDRLLMWQRSADSERLASFWELPERRMLKTATSGAQLGEFRHTITTTDYRVRVWRASVRRTPKGFEWVAASKLKEIPLSGAAKKAVLCLLQQRSKPSETGD